MNSNHGENCLVALIGLLTTTTGSWARTARLSVLIVVLSVMWGVSSASTHHAILAAAKIIYRSVS